MEELTREDWEKMFSEQIAEQIAAGASKEDAEWMVFETVRMLNGEDGVKAWVASGRAIPAGAES